MGSKKIGRVSHILRREIGELKTAGGHMTELAQNTQSIVDRFAGIDLSSLSLEEATRLFEKPWQSEVLWRVSLAGRLDREAVTTIVRPDVAGIPDNIELFDWLAAHREIEFNSSDNPTISAREADNRTLRANPNQLDAWIREVDNIRAFALKLSDHFAQRSEEWELDSINLLVLADPARALQRARKLYDAADTQSNFTRCFQILQRLEERTALLQRITSSWHPPMAEYPWLNEYSTFLKEVVELRRRFDASRAFASDFERTTQALERDVMKEAWHWVSGPIVEHDPWILNIEAKGGSGKTIFLRWLSARQCIREGIPYARLDFDFIDPRLTDVAPWYLVAQCARILDSQLEGRPLREIVARADDVASFDSLSLDSKHIARVFEQLRSTRAQEEGTELVNQLARALSGSSAKSVILVLDTLEVVLLNREADLLKLLNVLSQLHDQCPKLRVILAGRFDLEAKLPGFREQFSNQARPLELTRLSDDEAAEYLVTKRGMPRGAVVDAIVARSDGLPMSLSLYAEQWQINPRITATEINEIPGPELHYLVERVLKRVPVPIAWLLRYGVAARKLTKTFLQEIILPELIKLREGNALDNPMLDTDVIRQYYDTTKLALGQEELSADLLWADLERHASTFSFVSRDAAVPNCLIIHEEVLRPMRSELQKQPVLQSLHRRAMDLALARAGKLSGSNAIEWSSEKSDALYHALRISEEMALSCWKAASSEATQHGAYEAKMQIANELQDEFPESTIDLRILGARETTLALLDYAAVQPAEIAKEVRNKALKSSDQWEALLKEAQRAPDIASLIAHVRVRVTDFLGGDRAILLTLEGLLPTLQSDDERLELLKALIEANQYQPDALRHIATTRAILAIGAHSWSASNVTQFKLRACTEFARQGRYDLALELASEITTSRSKQNISDELYAYSCHVDLLTTCNRMADAFRMQQRAFQFDEKNRSEGVKYDLAAEDASLALRTTAVRVFSYGGPLLPPAPPTISDHADWIVIEQCNQALMARFHMRPTESQAVLQTARSAAGNSPALVARPVSNACGLALFLLGDQRRANELMDELRSLSLTEESDEWLDLQFKSCQYQRPRAAESLERLRDYNRRRPTVPTTLMMHVAELATDPNNHLNASREIVKELLKIQPVEARRRLFFEIIFGARHTELHPEVRPELAAALEMVQLSNGPSSKYVAEILQEWMLNKWITPDRVVEFPPFDVTNCLDLSKWYCDTQCTGRFTGLSDTMLDAPDISEFARGISLYASARKAFDEGDVAKATLHAQRARTILASESIPASIWLARANLLLYRLNAGGAADSEALLLTVEDLCERLDAQHDLAMVRDLLNLRRISQQLPSEKKSILSFEISPETVSALSHPHTSIVSAFNTDAARTTALRTPNNVIAELSKNFFDCVTDLAQLVPPVTQEYADDLRLAVVSAHPTVAALPLEIAFAKDAFQWQSTRQGRVVPGWRSVEPLHESVNERWVLRALNSLGIKSESGTGDLRALTSTFQAQQHLPESGALDARTLRQMIRALRGNRETRVAIIPAKSPPWLSAAHDGLMRFYGVAKAEVAILSKTSRETIATLQSQQFDVVHILAPVVESSSYGGLAFNLRSNNPEDYRQNVFSDNVPTDMGNPYLSLSELIGAIKRPSSLLRPIVVVHNTLDNLPLEEAIRQYCLRNIMAMEFNRSGAPVAAVGISTSLIASEQSIAGLLASILTAGEPLSNFLNKLDSRDHVREVLEKDSDGSAAMIVHELQRFGSLVYATNPEFVIV
ncbi:MAG: hypothetical protein ABJB66_00360 [Gemmatimonadaceae bacterium]